MDYKQAGVDVEKGDFFVKKIKGLVGETFDDRVRGDLGGFAAMYEMDEERFLSACTDGVGTKLKLAIELGIHDTIGKDLVAMCANDLICNGSRPLFFLDYLATGKLELETAEKVLKGIVDGCKEAGMALIGGETAEMPDMYAPKHYDLAGFSVGEVFKGDVLLPDHVQAGDSLVALHSSGFHSNGYSLVRKLIKDGEDELKRDCLTPTTIYVKPILRMLKELKGNVSGLANITGGGVDNISRMNENLSYHLTDLIPLGSLPAHMQTIIGRAGLPPEQLYRTFNMGMGMVVAARSFKELQNYLTDNNIAHQKIGEVFMDHNARSRVIMKS